MGLTKIIKRLSVAGLLSVLSLVVSLAPPAVADDRFSQGCQLYNAKNYTQAEPVLSETAKKYPKFWPGHYYLAHTFLALGKRTAARKEYEACLTSQPAPGADIVSVCQKVIVSLGGTLPDPAAAAESATLPADAKPADGKAVSADAGEKKDAPETLREQDRRLHIERLRKMASEKITVLRGELKEALAHGELNSNQWYKTAEGGAKIAMTEEDKQAIEKEYQDKITKVQEDSEREIAGIH